MKNYPSTFLNNLQSAVKANECVITDIDDASKMPQYIKINGVKVCLLNDKGRHDFINSVSDELTSIDYGKWKAAAAGRLFGKDWKRMNVKPEILNMYKFATTAVDNGNIKVRMLIREVTVDDFDSTDEFESFTDFIVNDIHYVIIKAYATNDELHEGFQYDSILEERMFEEKFTMIADAYMAEAAPSEDSDFNDIPDTDSDSDEQEELF